MVLLHIPPRAVHQKVHDWLQCLWHSHVKKWSHVASSAVCVLADDSPGRSYTQHEIFQKDSARRKCQFFCTVECQIRSKFSLPALRDWELVLLNREIKRELFEPVGEYYLCKAHEIPIGKILLISGCSERLQESVLTNY